jgi:hypothetical protein
MNIEDQMISSLHNLARNISNLPGWKTSSKFVVIESDDWGSTRMPSLSAFQKLEILGLDLRSADAERYNQNDTLETRLDLENLFEVLAEFKDSLGNSPIFTAVTIVANADFKRIRESGFHDYFYEPFTETLQRFTGDGKTFELRKEGIEKRLFVPQLHGREHLNVAAWMKDLKIGDNQARLAFNEGVTGFVPPEYPEVDYQAAFLLNNPLEMEYHEVVIKEGLDLFEKLFGFKAEYFVPPNGPFNNNLNKVLYENGIKYRSASKIQHEPLGNGKYRKVLHWLGQKEINGIRYITRNCFFEPSQQGKDWVDSCLNDIKIAFKWHKPSIISTHRVNYIGSLNPSNRDNGLRQLSKLLQEIIRNWPDVKFLTTPQLGALIDKSKSNG